MTGSDWLWLGCIASFVTLLLIVRLHARHDRSDQDADWQSDVPPHEMRGD